MSQRLELPWPLTVGLLATVVTVAFWPSYASLSPLVGTDSPDFVLVLLPLLAFPLVALDLRDARRDGEELGINLALATPFLAILVTLLVILPAKLSYAYWLYRLDLLAVPVFLATAILLVFGFPALWSARRGLVLLLCGWPPVVDAVIRAAATPLASVEASFAHALPLGVGGSGSTFLFPDGQTLVLSTACAGLVAVFSAGGVGGVIALVLDGPVVRRLAWLASAVLLALAGNIIRLVIVVAAGARFGTGSVFSLLHGAAGLVVFALTFGVSLLMLPRFGLELRLPGSLRGGQVPLRAHGALAVLATLVVLAVLGAILTGTSATPGLFNGVPDIGANLLSAPAGWTVSGRDDSPGIAQSFGGGTRASIVHLTRPGENGVAAQVVVTRSYRQAREFGVLQCFSFHDDTIESTRFASLGRGGTAAIVSLRIGGEEISSASWLQPVLLDGRHAWRRIVLYEYAPAQAGARATASASDGLSLWLLNHLAPYGRSTPPPAYRHAEQQLLAVASSVARSGD